MSGWAKVSSTAEYKNRTRVAPPKHWTQCRKADRTTNELRLDGGVAAAETPERMEVLMRHQDRCPSSSTFSTGNLSSVVCCCAVLVVLAVESFKLTRPTRPRNQGQHRCFSSALRTVFSFSCHSAQSRSTGPVGLMRYCQDLPDAGGLWSCGQPQSLSGFSQALLKGDTPAASGRPSGTDDTRHSLCISFWYLL